MKVKRISILFFVCLFSVYSHYIHDFVKMRMTPLYATRSITRSFGEDMQVSTDHSPFSIGVRPVIVRLTSGNIVIAWIDMLEPYNVYFQRLDSSGAKVGSETRVNTSNGSARSNVPAIVSLGSGFVVSWIGGSSPFNIYFQRFDAEGAPVGTQANIEAGAFTSASLATISLGTGFVVVWQNEVSPYEICFQRFDAEGAPVGTQVSLTATHGPYKYTPIRVAKNSDNNFIISWVEDGSFNIYGQLFDSDGAKIGGEKQINTDYRAGKASSIASLGSGFVMSWVSLIAPHNVYCQRLDALGNKVGVETQVDTIYPSGSFAGTWVAEIESGFVVSWFSGGSPIHLYCQRLDASGNKEGEEVQVDQSHASSTTDSDDKFPTVAGLSGNQFIVSWIRGTFPYHVYANIFGSATTTGTVSGYTKDENDTGIEGITIQLKSGDMVVDSTTSDAGGSYTFSNVSAGDYTVGAGNKNNYQLISTSSKVVTVTAGQTSTANFTYRYVGQNQAALSRVRILAPQQFIPLRFIETANEYYTQLRNKVNDF